MNQSRSDDSPPHDTLLGGVIATLTLYATKKAPGVIEGVGVGALDGVVDEDAVVDGVAVGDGSAV